MLNYMVGEKKSGVQTPLKITCIGVTEYRPKKENSMYNHYTSNG